MDDREKLKQIVKRAAHSCLPSNTQALHINLLVTDLLANGVVVREWIPVTERLPEAEDVCLCFDGRMMAVLQWDERAERWVDYRRSYPKSSVTHWMPLPQPPKGE